MKKTEENEKTKRKMKKTVKIEDDTNSDGDYGENTITQEEINQIIQQHYMSKTNNELKNLLRKYNQSVKGNKDSFDI